MSLTIREIRDRAERFHAAMAEEAFEARAGRKAWPELQPLFATQSVLGFERAMPVVQRELASATGDERRCLQRLLAWIAEHHVRAANAELDDEFAQWMASATVLHEGDDVPVRKLPGLIRSTEDRPARRAWARLYLDVLGEVLPLQLDRLNRWRTATVELGFGDYRQMILRLTGLNLGPASVEARRFLELTEEAYRARLGQVLAEHFGVSALDAEQHDAQLLNRQKWLDGVADEAALLERLREDLDLLGLPLEAEGRIDLVVEAFPSPGMRPACHALHVPDRVLVLVTPTTSIPGLRRLMREVGRGLHWAYTSPLLPFEFRVLGDRSVLHAHATLFGALSRNPAWVRHALALEGDDLRSYATLGAFLELYATRRMAARLLFDLELADSDRPAAMGPRWAELMEDATGFRHDPRGFLAELGQRFGAARRFRGRMLAARLSGELESRFGDGWYRERPAGEFLREWFAEGLTHDADGLAARLGPGAGGRTSGPAGNRQQGGGGPAGSGGQPGGGGQAGASLTCDALADSLIRRIQGQA